MGGGGGGGWGPLSVDTNVVMVLNIQMMKTITVLANAKQNV